MVKAATSANAQSPMTTQLQSGNDALRCRRSSIRLRGSSSVAMAPPNTSIPKSTELLAAFFFRAAAQSQHPRRYTRDDGMRLHVARNDRPGADRGPFAHRHPAQNHGA